MFLNETHCLADKFMRVRYDFQHNLDMKDENEIISMLFAVCSTDLKRESWELFAM